MRKRLLTSTRLASLAAGYCCLFLTPGIADAEPIRPVADLHQVPIEGSSLPGNFMATESGAYFTAFQPNRGRELWWSDGTAQGTRLVADLCPGSCSSSPTPLAGRGDELFFAYGDHLWFTDGTDAGTRSLKEICPDCTFPYFGAAMVLGDRLVFITQYPANSEAALFVSDGTPEGTGPISSISFGPSFPLWLEKVGDFGLFFVNDDDGSFLWRTDGTAEGTGVVEQLCDGCFNHPRLFSVLGDRLIFSADDGKSGAELWVSDGTADGTFMLADLIPGETGSNPAYPARLGNLLYGTLSNCSGPCVFVTDGTVAGTRFAPELYPALATGTVRQTAVAGSTLYVQLTENFEDELWALGGLGGQSFIAGADLIDIRGEAGGSLLFHVFEEGPDWDLWTTSGTSESTRQIGSLYSNSMVQIGEDRAILSGRVLNTQQNAYLSELWLTDGSTAVELVDISPPFASSNPTDLLVWGDDVVLYSDRRNYWRVNEQSAEILVPDTYQSLSRVIGDQLFIYSWERRGFEVFDRGGQARFVEVPLRPPILMEHQGTAYFTQGPSQQGLWAIRDDGPELIIDINPGWSYACPILCPPPYPEFPDQLTSYGETLVFTAFDDVDGPAQLWRSDGTAESTRLIREFEMSGSRSPAWDSPKNLTRAGGRIFFTAFDAPSGNELWLTDATAQGTRLIADLTPGEGSSDLTLLTPWGDEVALVQRTNDGDRLWRAGASGELALISELVPRSEVHELVSSGDQLFASITAPSLGRELWVSYGSPERTYPLDLRPGELRGSGVTGLTAIPGGVFFGADGTRESGFEPWVSDGSANGTRMIDDLFAGPAPSSPGPAVLIGETLYFAAEDDQIDRELFALDLADVGPLGCPENRLCLGLDRFEVALTWHTGSGASGEAKRVSADDESGLMWFFEPDNWEAMVKVLDGCSINGHFWVFAATSTNVGYTLSVEDVQTGTVKTYVNAVGENAPAITDTEALGVCP